MWPSSCAHWYWLHGHFSKHLRVCFLLCPTHDIKVRLQCTLHYVDSFMRNFAAVTRPRFLDWWLTTSMLPKLIISLVPFVWWLASLRAVIGTVIFFDNYWRGTVGCSIEKTSILAYDKSRCLKGIEQRSSAVHGSLQAKAGGSNYCLSLNASGVPDLTHKRTILFPPYLSWADLGIRSSMLVRHHRSSSSISLRDLTILVHLQ